MWYRKNFRCQKVVFDIVLAMVEHEWHQVNAPLGPQTYFNIRDRLAVTMHYLAHPGTLSQSASVFGMSRSTASRCIWQVVTVFEQQLQRHFLYVPNSADGWDELRKGFAEFCGFPNTYLAVDGTLLSIERPAEFQGFYCRKRYPALNMMIACDHTMMVRSFEVCPGSENDRGMYNRSKLKTYVDRHLPPGGYLIGDAGYTLYDNFMTPYEVKPDMGSVKRKYNFKLSQTRMIVERTIGLFKGRFRRFTRELDQKDHTTFDEASEEMVVETAAENMGRLITCAVVLHNIFVTLGDTDVDLYVEEENHDAELDRSLQAAATAVTKRDILADWVTRNLYT
jgi:hypothetical protein